MRHASKICSYFLLEIWRLRCQKLLELHIKSDYYQIEMCLISKAHMGEFRIGTFNANNQSYEMTTKLSTSICNRTSCRCVCAFK